MRSQPESGRGIRTGRGVLIVVAGLFLASTFFRVLSGSGAALAREVDALRPPVQTAEMTRLVVDDLEALLTELRTREAALAERERLAETRVAAAELAEERVAQGLLRLDRAEEALRATMALSETASETDLAQLTAVYENMKPQQAAALFQRMTPAFAAGFLGRMRPEAAAGILAGLDPENAYAISVILAGRNANAGRSLE